MSGSNRTSPVPTAPSPGATSTKSQKCTAGRVRSIIKEIFAQLFSQVGLCLLVVGYSVMGATVFMSLEQPNELLTRIKVGSTRNQTLDDLYNLTGKFYDFFICCSNSAYSEPNLNSTLINLQFWQNFWI